VTEPGTLTISFQNISEYDANIVIRPKDVVISRFKKKERVTIGYEHTEICDGDVCSTVKTPVYEETKEDVDIYGEYILSHRKLMLNKNSIRTIDIKLTNHRQATRSFNVEVFLSVYIEGEMSRLKIVCPSKYLLQ
jgi:hypothetical protein